MKQIPFALFDDNILRAHALKRVLLCVPPLKYLFKTPSKSVLLESLKSQSVELLIVSYPFSQKESEDVIEQVRKENPAIKIMVLPNTIDSEILILIDDGANAVLSPHTRPAEFQQAIIETMKEEYFFNELFSKAMFHELKKRKAFKKNIPNEENVTEQDIAIMNFLFAELTHKEIGDKMDLKPKTIDTYVTGLIHKVNARNVIGLIKFGLKKKLIKEGKI